MVPYLLSSLFFWCSFSWVVFINFSLKLDNPFLLLEGNIFTSLRLSGSIDFNGLSFLINFKLLKKLFGLFSFGLFFLKIFWIDCLIALLLIFFKLNKLLFLFFCSGLNKVFLSWILFNELFIIIFGKVKLFSTLSFRAISFSKLFFSLFILWKSFLLV